MYDRVQCMVRLQPSCAHGTLHGVQRQRESGLAPNRLAELRQATGLRLVQVAAKLDVDQSTVYRYEQGQTPVPDPVKATLAELYGVTRAYLMGWDEDEQETAA